MREQSEDDAAPEPRVPAETTTAYHGRRNDDGRCRGCDYHGSSGRGHNRWSNHDGGSRRCDHHDWRIRHAGAMRAAVETGPASTRSMRV